MKKTLFLSVSLLTTFFLSAQITFTSADMPVAGWDHRVAKDTLPLPVINWGNPGANQIYDFSNLTSAFTDTVMYRTLTNGQQSAFPNADVSVSTDGASYLYTRTQTSKQTLEGIEGKLVPGGNTLQAGFNPVSDLFHFPTTMGTAFSGTAMLTKTVAGSDVGQPTIYQVRMTLTSKYSDLVDGWGTVITPVGSYDCLRKKRIDTTTTLIEYKLLSFSPWATLSNTTSITTRYSYPTKEAKGSALTFDYDSANNVTGVSYSLIPPPPIANFGYTAGGGGLILFSDSAVGPVDSYSWDFGDGTNGNGANPTHTYSANGAYYVCQTVTNVSGQSTYCDSVYVTGITAANNPPLAFTDTVTLTQATSVTFFHVAANDVDPDNDNLCVSAVWGSPYVTLGVGGSCDIVDIVPDSTFVGTDTAYYQICDDGTPSLCDTGMIIFTVVADPNLLPVAGFSYVNFTYGNCTGITLTNTSANTSSVAWTVSPINPQQADSSYGNINSFMYYGDMTATMALDVEVCLTATNQFGTASTCDTATLSCTTGINNLTEGSVSIYPNPALNLVTVETTNDINASFTSLEIINVVGEVVKHVQLYNSNINSVDVSTLSAGVYFIKLQNKDSYKIAGRFTKE